MSTHWKLLFLILFYLLGGGSLWANEANLAKELQPFFARHCIGCHGPEKEKGGLRIDQLSTSLDDLESVEHFQNILDEITIGSMPPEEEPRPTDAEFAVALPMMREHVQRAAEKHNSGGGRPVRRLTKIEYTNTVLDLMGVHLQPLSLPDDGEVGAFDTEATSLYTNDMYFEAYLEVARDAVRRFIAGRLEKPGQQELKGRDAPTKPIAKFELGSGEVPPAGHLVASFACWLEDPSADEPVFTGPVDGAKHEVLGTSDKPQMIRSSFYHPKDREIWIRPPKMVLGATKYFRFVSPQPFQFFENFLGQEVGASLPESTAKPIIHRFVTLMNRGRTVDQELVNELNQIFVIGRQQGEPFWEAIVEPMALSMCSLEAMYHFEDRNPARDSRYVSAIEYANRLSYFLWRSTPDRELVEFARSGKIYDPIARNEKINSMMKDEKFDRFVTDFTNQWLELERQDLIAVDYRLFRDFDEGFKHAMKGETFEFIAHVIRENLPLSTLIDSDFAIVNNVMASYYGLPRVHGDAFRRVSLPADDKRGGILTQAGILMQTGTGERTSIVERGVFVARKMLDADPPPPPPLVEDLPTSGDDFNKMTGAELVRAHAESAQCASCHNKIDPLGVGLEHFDAIGRYRTEDVRIKSNYHEIGKRNRRNFDNITFKVALETQGRYFDGQTFDDSDGLKAVLLKNKNRLTESFVKALLSMANGREAGVADKAIVDDIVAKTAGSNYLARTILKSVVESEAFKIN